MLSVAELRAALADVPDSWEVIVRRDDDSARYEISSVEAPPVGPFVYVTVPS